MSVFEKRETIIQTQNTAQSEFEQILASFPTSTKEIVINKTLHGDLDLAILKKQGYNSVIFIQFSNSDSNQRGEITSIKNLPIELRKFSCTNQLLVDVDLWLPRLEELNLEKNYLKTIDLTTLVKCKKLVLNMNELEILKSVPTSLEEIYVNDNRLKSFDFNATPKLRVFHCINNPQIKLVNVPRGNVDIKMDETGASVSNSVSLQYEDEPSMNTTVAHSRESRALRNLSYVECLRDYFKLKNKYETKTYELRQKVYNKHKSHKIAKQHAMNVIPPCINCGRKVGSIFTTKDNRFIAMCGDKSKPCPLRIELFRGNYDNLNMLLQQYRAKLETQKEDIIRQKMDTLFNFVSETDAVKLFKEKLEDYNLKSSMYKDYTDKYISLFENEQKRTLVKTKMEHIYQLKDTMANMAKEFETQGSHVVLQTLVGIYEKEYVPEILNLRRLHYEVMEMDSSNENEQILFQHEVELSKLDYLWGEEPRVIAYQTTL